MSDNGSYYDDNQEDYFPKDIIWPMVQYILQSADPSLSEEDAVKEAMLPMAAKIYAEAVNSGVTELDASYLMLMFGFALGFEVGHIDGHVCAEGFVPDTIDQMFLNGD